MSDKVSVIIPVYKVEKYLARCVDSALNQTHKNLEIILVDDGSPDSCPQLCEDYAKKDARVKVVHKANGGLSSARNAGLDLFSGDYVTFLDSDDMLAIDFVDRLLNISKTYKAEVVACKTKRFTDNETPIPLYTDKVKLFTREQALANTFKVADNAFIISCAKLFKAEIFKQLRFINGVIHEDERSCHLIFDKVNTFAVCEDELYLYYENPNSITGVKYNLKRTDYLYALEDRVVFFKQNYPSLYPEMALHFAYRCIDLYYEVPKINKQKAIRKDIKKLFKRAKVYLKGIKTPSSKRFGLFSFCPLLYKIIFKK